MTQRLEDFPDDLDVAPVPSRNRPPTTTPTARRTPNTRGMRLSSYKGGRGATTNLPVVVDILRAAGGPMRLAEIVKHGYFRFPTRSAFKSNVVSRDVALHILEHGELSSIVRVAKGTYDLRERVSK